MKIVFNTFEHNIGATLLFGSLILQNNWLGHCCWLKKFKPIHKVLEETKEGVYIAMTKTKVYITNTKKKFTL